MSKLKCNKIFSISSFKSDYKSEVTVTALHTAHFGTFFGMSDGNVIFIPYICVNTCKCVKCQKNTVIPSENIQKTSAENLYKKILNFVSPSRTTESKLQSLFTLPVIFDPLTSRSTNNSIEAIVTFDKGNGRELIVISAESVIGIAEIVLQNTSDKNKKTSQTQDSVKPSENSGSSEKLSDSNENVKKQRRDLQKDSFVFGTIPYNQPKKKQAEIKIKISHPLTLFKTKHAYDIHSLIIFQHFLFTADYFNIEMIDLFKISQSEWLNTISEAKSPPKTPSQRKKSSLSALRNRSIQDLPVLPSHSIFTTKLILTTIAYQSDSIIAGTVDGQIVFIDLRTEKQKILTIGEEDINNTIYNICTISLSKRDNQNVDILQHAHDDLLLIRSTNKIFLLHPRKGFVWQKELFVMDQSKIEQMKNAGEFYERKGCCAVKILDENNLIESRVKSTENVLENNVNTILLVTPVTKGLFCVTLEYNFSTRNVLETKSETIRTSKTTILEQFGQDIWSGGDVVQLWNILPP